MGNVGIKAEDGIAVDEISVKTPSGSQIFKNASGTEVGSYDNDAKWSLGTASTSGWHAIYGRNADGSPNNYIVSISAGGVAAYSIGVDTTNSKIYHRNSPGYSEEVYIGANKIRTVGSNGNHFFGPASANVLQYLSGYTQGYHASSNATSQILYLHSDVGGTNILKWRVDCDGDTISATGSYTSDERAKKDIFPIHYGLAEILQLQPVSFRWKYEGAEDVRSFSLSTAQHLEQIMPEMVIDDGLEGEDDEGNKITYKAIYDKEVMAVVVKAIQEQQAIIESLQAQIDELKNQ